MTLYGVLHHPYGTSWDVDIMTPLPGDLWRQCPKVPPNYWARRYDFDILNRLERGELPNVIACPICLPHLQFTCDIILVTPARGAK